MSKLKFRPLKSVLFQVEGGLSEIGGAAEVAPVVLVGAEGEDFFALGREPKVGGDDREDAFFGEHGEEARGDDVDAGESEGLKRGWSRFLRPEGLSYSMGNKFRFAIGADHPAAELEMVVEEEGARSFAGLDGEGGEGAVLGVELQHAAEIDGADDVDVVEEKGLVHLIGVATFAVAGGGIFEEKPGGFFQAAAGVQ